MIAQKNVAIVGGGTAGIAAALALTQRGVPVTLFEKAFALGGHAARLGCKATDQCVRCGACMVHEMLLRIGDHNNIRIMTATQVEQLDDSDGLRLTYRRRPICIDAQKCDACGVCLEKCPNPGALVRSRPDGFASPMILVPELCQYFKDRSCAVCREVCRHDAIDLTVEETTGVLKCGAIIVAGGFSAFDPSEKPYGYGLLPNVVTNLDAERILQDEGRFVRPSDGRTPRKVAFLQCVGSRDKRGGHPYCSKICCGSALRMANLILHHQPDTQVTFFYIDVQHFGRDFQTFYERVQNRVRMVRAVPGDIVAGDDDGLRASYFDPKTHKSIQETFDMVILSIGLRPSMDNRSLAVTFGLDLNEDGFCRRQNAAGDPARGVFLAGTLAGPMTISESMDDAVRTAWDVWRYFQETP